jgi:arylsulfatase A-like enzyme
VRFVSTRILVIAATLTLLSGVLSRAGAETKGAVPVPAEVPRRGIVLVTIDSLRPDHLGCYNNAVKSTPHFDALASAGTRFARAYTSSVSTVPATAGILTGLYPSRHGLRHDLGGRLPADVPTLAGRLHAAGWSTAAVIATSVLKSESGLDRGFDRYDDDYKGIRRMILTQPERRASEVLEAGFAAFDQMPADRPFFLWLNLHDPAYDYEAPEPQKTDFKSSPYDGEVAFVDATLGTLVDRLADKAHGGSITLVVAGSHGEGLGDHGETGHGTYLYESTIRVPLIVTQLSPRGAPAPAVPAAATGVVVDDPVSLIDIAPSILEIAGAPAAAGLSGVSFAGRLHRDAATGAPQQGRARPERRSEVSRPVYVEAADPWYEYGWNALFAVVDKDRKVVQGTRLESFDLSTDRSEAAPLTKPPPWAAALVGFGHPLLGSLEIPADRRKSIDEAVARASFPWEDSPFCAAKGERPDPRDPDHVAASEKLFVARWNWERGAVGLPMAPMTKLLETDPSNLAALEFVVRLGVRNRWGPMLLDNFETMQCDYPYLGTSYHFIGHYYEGAKDYPRAVAAFQIFLMAEPIRTDAEYDLACALAGLNRKDDAFEHLRQSFQLGNDDLEGTRKDPRLANLRDDPRFEAMLGEFAPP